MPVTSPHPPMLRGLLWILTAACALLSAVPGPASAEPLRANAGGLAPTVRVGRADQQVLGPAGFAVGGEAVFLADPLASRAVELDRRLRPRAAWPFALAPHDLLPLGRGRLCAIDAAAEHLECRASATAPGPTVTRRLRPGAVALVRGPADAVWVQRGDGFAGPAWGSEALVHALPLESPPRWQAAGLWHGPARLEVLVWPWSVHPDAKGVEPTRTLSFGAPAQLRAGSVRPLRSDSRGNVYVALEWLGGGSKLEVTEQVVRVAPDGRRADVRWLASSYAPGLQDLEVDDQGAVWRLHHTPGWVHLDALPLRESKEVPR